MLAGKALKEVLPRDKDAKAENKKATRMSGFLLPLLGLNQGPPD